MKNHTNANIVNNLFLKIHIWKVTWRHILGRSHINVVVLKIYSKKTDLTSHKITHTGKKLHQGSDCEKAFSKTGDLNSHKMTHTGEKPYQWSDCEKSSKNIDLELYKDSQWRKTISVQIYWKKFSHNYQLERHIKSHTM